MELPRAVILLRPEVKVALYRSHGVSIGPVDGDRDLMAFFLNLYPLRPWTRGCDGRVLWGRTPGGRLDPPSPNVNPEIFRSPEGRDSRIISGGGVTRFPMAVYSTI